VGLSNIAREWWGWGESVALWLSRLFGLLLLITGLRAVLGVVA
jgi:hypothetical protein